MRTCVVGAVLCLALLLGVDLCGAQTCPPSYPFYISNTCRTQRLYTYMHISQCPLISYPYLSLDRITFDNNPAPYSTCGNDPVRYTERIQVVDISWNNFYLGAALCYDGYNLLTRFYSTPTYSPIDACAVAGLSGVGAYLLVPMADSLYFHFQTCASTTDYGVTRWQIDNYGADEPLCDAGIRYPIATYFYLNGWYQVPPCPTCQHGSTCPPTGSCCTCPTNYYGCDCSIYCDTTTCNGRGTCSATGQCVCMTNYDVTTNCNSCAANCYHFPDCLYCDSDLCNLHGTCNVSTGLCDCDGGYEGGVNCSGCDQDYYNFPVCTFCTKDLCNNNGICNATGLCKCNEGWDPATNCSTCLTNYYGNNCFYCEKNETCAGLGECGDEGCTCLDIKFNSSNNCHSCSQDHYNYPECAYCEKSNTCSGGGTCNSTGGCVCDFKYDASTNCSTCISGLFNYPDCITCSESTCNFRGSCNATTGGKCVCAEIYYDASTNCATCLPQYANLSTCNPPSCDNNHGGCDYRVTCTMGTDGPVCGPCPSGTYGSGLFCQLYCGDHNCSEHENCVSCPIDCNATVCDACGDGTCNGNETCTSCPEDCVCLTAPVPCISALCSNHGTCLDGACHCDANWFGPTCSSSSIQTIQPTLNSSTPSLTLTPASSPVQFFISIKAISELSISGNPIQTITIPSINGSLATSTNGSNTISSYTLPLENRALLIVTIYLFGEDTKIEFAGNSTSYPRNSVKLTLQISRWPFSALSNSLAVIFDAKSGETGECVKSQSSGTGNLQWVLVVVDSVALYGQFQDVAVIDGRTRKISNVFHKDENSVYSILPHFWDSAEMDPNYSVLLGDKTAASCAQNTKKNKKLLAVYIVVPIVVVVFAAALIVLLPRIRTKITVMRTKTPSHAHLNKDIEIEKIEGHEVTSHAGNFKL